MLKILMIIISICLGYAAFIILQKISKTQFYLKKYQAKKLQLSKQPVITPKKTELVPTERVVDAYELELFDDIACQFIMQAIRSRDVSEASIIQSEWLNKMPMHTHTEIRHLDLNEWSIVWQFYDQSLEYYVGRYGIFYMHVNQYGHEQHVKIQDELS